MAGRDVSSAPVLGLQKSFTAHRLSGALSLFQIPFGAAPRGEALVGLGGTPDAERV